VDGENVMRYGTCLKTNRLSLLQNASDVKLISVDPLLAKGYVNVIIETSLTSEEVIEKYKIQHLNAVKLHLD
jgi:hypothetical protein